MRKRYLIGLLLTTAVWAAGQIPTARQQVLEAMRQRPDDPWPRGQGHVPLAVPGSEELQKAYHEPGGSFSPAVRSFGISLWITSPEGRIVRTSDSIPLAELKQKLVWRAGVVQPSIATQTSEYRTVWSVGPANGGAHLALSARPAGHKIMLAIRSVGPAGAAIESLRWNGRRLRINGRFSVVIVPAPASVYVGTEGTAGWTMAHGEARDCAGQNGWCYARIELPGPGIYSLSIRDSYPRPAPTLAASSTRAALELQLPDPRFAEALDAQVAHLMMSLVSNQTRPGEPMNYPLAWLRDGAYQVVALARTGRLDTARELVRYFADNDFFGGFGAEGDAPGLSLWAIGEVAARTRDRGFDEFLWPHVHRKARFIEGLMATAQPVERFSTGPIVPGERWRKEIYEVAKPAQEGLISGRMDHATRPLFTSAVSYRGLVLASEFAQRVGATEDAERWRATANSLQQAWLRKFTPEDADERTFMCGLFPTWIAAPRRTDYEAGLRRYWEKTWRPEQGGLRDESGKSLPLWTYFNFAHAHNWLYAGQLDPVWKTLNWFWDHQASPGLYTWWEGKGEENAFRQWDSVRGWVQPAHVTPHYWTAATDLLLQLDMLAYVDESERQPSLVVGGGIPAQWCAHPMSVHGMVTKLGAVDWDWDGRAMRVRLRGQRCPVRLGPAFPHDSQLKVEYGGD